MKPWILLLILATCWPRVASAGGTATLPRGVFLLDESLLDATTDVRFDDNRQARPLIEGIERYEPGGGLQGVITAQPFVRYRFVVSQLWFGVTDKLTAGVGVPLVTSTTIDPKLGWTSGHYQSGLGRPYSESDFWQWAKSMGQDKPGAFAGNANTLADIVLGARYRLPQTEAMKKIGLLAAVAVQGALPTGAEPDPEELVAAGTTVWDLHNYADLEGHVALDRPFEWDGVTRLNLGLSAWYGWMRARTFKTSTGARHPLLMTHAPYVGETYTVDPGDLLGVQGMVEVVPWVGPTRASWIAKGRLEVAESFPPLLTLSAGLSHVSLQQSDWQSQSAVWDWDREKLWLPGDKNTVRLGGEISLLRLGLPVQLYAGYRNQEWIPGKNIRASNVATGGMKLLLKFW